MSKQDLYFRLISNRLTLTSESRFGAISEWRWTTDSDWSMKNSRNEFSIPVAHQSRLWKILMQKWTYENGFIKLTTVRPRYYAPLYYADLCYTRIFSRKLVSPTISCVVLEICHCENVSLYSQTSIVRGCWGYQISKNFPRITEVRVVKRSIKFWHPFTAKVTDLKSGLWKENCVLRLYVVSVMPQKFLLDYQMLKPMCLILTYGTFLHSHSILMLTIQYTLTVYSGVKVGWLKNEI
jgi:hypothetical protein